MQPTSAPRFATLLTALLTTLACSSGAHAQAVYRIVGPDGKISFSDRPPPDAAAPPARSSSAEPAAAAPAAALPYELRQIAARFPVTIYTGADCAPCASLRSLLSARGVPFAERTVNSNDDIAALQRLSGSSSLPFGSIGGQQLTGYSDAEWNQYLDAAGYPKQSQLPANYRPTPPAPLVAIKPLDPASAPKAPPPTPAPQPAPAAPRSAPPPPTARHRATRRGYGFDLRAGGQKMDVCGHRHADEPLRYAIVHALAAETGTGDAR